jgi:hypothetical protein
MIQQFLLKFNVKSSEEKAPTFDQVLEAAPLALAKLESRLSSSDPEIVFVGLSIEDWRLEGR